MTVQSPSTGLLHPSRSVEECAGKQYEECGFCVHSVQCSFANNLCTYVYFKMAHPPIFYTLKILSTVYIFLKIRLHSAQSINRRILNE